MIYDSGREASLHKNFEEKKTYPHFRFFFLENKKNSFIVYRVEE
jgi:hypothetical protein